MNRQQAYAVLDYVARTTRSSLLDIKGNAGGVIDPGVRDALVSAATALLELGDAVDVQLAALAFEERGMNVAVLDQPLAEHPVLGQVFGAPLAGAGVNAYSFEVDSKSHDHLVAYPGVMQRLEQPLTGTLSGPPVDADGEPVTFEEPEWHVVRHLESGKVLKIHPAYDEGEYERLEGEVLDHVEAPLVRAACEVLREELGGTPIRQWVGKDPDGWFRSQAPVVWHFRGGMAVRNLLRDRGYTEDVLGVANLDDVYVDLVTMALRDAPPPGDAS